MSTIIIRKGGPGSGNYGHAGRPGKKGGSAPKEGIGAAMSIRSGKTAEERQISAGLIGRPVKIHVEVGRPPLEGVIVGVGSNRYKLKVQTADGIIVPVDSRRYPTEIGKRPTKSNQPKAKPEDDKAIKELSEDERTQLKRKWTRGSPDSVDWWSNDEALSSMAGRRVNTIDFVNETFNYTDADTGLSAKVSRVRYDSDDNTFEVNGNFYTPDGANVGVFTRTFKYDIKEVHHDLMSIEEKYQNTGFGSKFYRHLEDGYSKVGVKQVTIYANIDVGGYAWARMGFDWNSRGDPSTAGRSTKASIIAGWERRYGAIEAGMRSAIQNAHAYELAMVTGPDGFKIGKEYMLGTSWNAIKFLDPTSTTYQVGRAYYDSKPKGKSIK